MTSETENGQSENTSLQSENTSLQTENTSPKSEKILRKSDAAGADPDAVTETPGIPAFSGNQADPKRPGKIKFTMNIPEIDKMTGHTIPDGSVMIVYGSDFDGIGCFLRNLGRDGSACRFRLIGTSDIFQLSHSGNSPGPGSSADPGISGNPGNTAASGNSGNSGNPRDISGSERSGASGGTGNPPSVLITVVDPVFSGISSEKHMIPAIISGYLTAFPDIPQTLLIFVFWSGTVSRDTILSFSRFSETVLEFRKTESGDFIERAVIAHRLPSGNAVTGKVRYLIRNDRIVIEQTKRVYRY